MNHVINALSTVWYFCTKCQSSFLVDMDDSARHLLKKSMRCPNFITCKGRVNERGFTTKNMPTGEIKNARKVSATELYQATMGIGLANERKCSPRDIRQLLTGARISQVQVEKASDPQKSILLSITLDNGKAVHLSSSTHGAIVYKVTEARHAR